MQAGLNIHINNNKKTHQMIKSIRKLIKKMTCYLLIMDETLTFSTFNIYSNDL